jgi:hypothetical protein
MYSLLFGIVVLIIEVLDTTGKVEGALVSVTGNTISVVVFYGSAVGTFNEDNANVL